MCECSALGSTKTQKLEKKNIDLLLEPLHDQRGGGITVGCIHRGASERAMERAGDGGSGSAGFTSKYLFLSICMDLTGLIWQLRGREGGGGERTLRLINAKGRCAIGIEEKL